MVVRALLIGCRQRTGLESNYVEASFDNRTALRLPHRGSLKQYAATYNLVLFWQFARSRSERDNIWCNWLMDLGGRTGDDESDESDESDDAPFARQGCFTTPF